MMGDAALLELIKTGGDIPLPYFDGQTVKILNEDFEPHDVLPTLKNFLALSTDNRKRDARHLHAYYKHTLYMAEEYVLEDMNGVKLTLEQVWEHTTPTLIYFSMLKAGKYAKSDTMYLILEGSVAWEIEHGLLMSWKDGSSLVKAGAFDGHPTNGHATANPENDKYIFYSYTEGYSTLPDKTS